MHLTNIYGYVVSSLETELEEGVFIRIDIPVRAFGAGMKTFFNISADLYSLQNDRRLVLGFSLI